MSCLVSDRGCVRCCEWWLGVDGGAVRGKHQRSSAQPSPQLSADRWIADAATRDTAIDRSLDRIRRRLD